MLQDYGEENGDLDLLMGGGGGELEGEEEEGGGGALHHHHHHHIKGRKEGDELEATSTRSSLSGSESEEELE